MKTKAKANIERLIDALERKHWKVSLKQNTQVRLTDSFRLRYAAMPEDYLLFLSMVEVCEDPTGRIWFLTENDYNERIKKPLAWDFCETLSLDAAKEATDPDVLGEVKRFWSHYLPIALSAKAEYIYLAIGVHPSNFNQIIRGIEPEFEVSSKIICESFSQLCNFYADMVEGGQHLYELEDFM